MPTQLARRRAAYQRAIDRADELRDAFVAEILIQQAAGRSLADIGRELGVVKQRVLQLIQAYERRNG